MSTTPLRAVCLGLVLIWVAGASASQQLEQEDKALNIYYLEIVTPSVEETCNALEKVHGVTFGEAVAELGNARTASLEGGGRIGVRAPDQTETKRPHVRCRVRARSTRRPHRDGAWPAPCVGSILDDDLERKGWRR